jgi:hypothetical protein
LRFNNKDITCGSGVGIGNVKGVCDTEGGLCSTAVGCDRTKLNAIVGAKCGTKTNDVKKVNECAYCNVNTCEKQSAHTKNAKWLILLVL